MIYGDQNYVQPDFHFLYPLKDILGYIFSGTAQGSNPIMHRRPLFIDILNPKSILRKEYVVLEM